MTYEKICEGCGKAFEAGRYNTRYCCVACKEAGNKRNVDAANKRFRQKEREKEAGRDRRNVQKRKRKIQSQLAQINEEARKNGMTYGQYVGMKDNGLL